MKNIKKQLVISIGTENSRSVSLLNCILNQVKEESRIERIKKIWS